MKKMLCSLILCSALGLFFVQTALAASVQAQWTWTPDPSNTAIVDKFTVQRQSQSSGPWVEVCSALGAERSCTDMAVPSGSYCWKVIPSSGTMQAPESAPACLQVHQFTGTTTIILSVQP